ncbi:MAG TPA: PhzF family phenazine biosynthesis protein [Candidatus Nanopelagicales bacterium]|nr:PhzF family phenazine biosynthesis protein [Candidatus Nanopelagicales bacterium]
MTQRRPFRQVDVFADSPLAGNPVAVTLDLAGLTTDEMQRFTEWTNLSEATFVGPPTHADADYAVRIFCPGRELPFAGHPTLGSCHAWLEAGGVPKGEHIVQECGAGLVRIRRTGDRLAFAAPPLDRSGPLSEQELDDAVRFLGIAREDVVAHSWCDNGPGWRGLLLSSAELVLSLAPDAATLHGMDVGVVGLHPAGAEVDVEIRTFFPGAQGGLTEDPVTGSFNAAVGQWLIAEGRLPRTYVAAQGTALGRRGRIHVEREGDDVWVGGHCITVLDGTVAL